MTKTTWDKLWKKQQKKKGLFDRILWQLRHNTSRAYAERISNILKGGKSPKILEIGCGSAVTFKYLKQRMPNSNLTGLDYSQPALDLALEINPDCKFIRADAKKIPLKPNLFDVTYSLGLIEHFSRSDALKIIKEHARVTKIGGHVMIVVPAKYPILNVARIVMGKRWPYGFEDPFSRTELVRMMKASGLKHLKIRRIRTIVLCAIGEKVK